MSFCNYDKCLFSRLKHEIFKLLVETKDLIRARHAIQIRKGNTVEVIQQNSVIRAKLQELENKFVRMKEVYKKNMKQQGKVRAGTEVVDFYKLQKYSEEQLNERFKEMQLIRTQITETVDLDKNAAMKTEAEVQTLTDFKYERLV